jgi:hypothetical protein
MSWVHSSCAPDVVVLPWVAVEVDLPLDLEVVIPLEIFMVLRLWLLNLGSPLPVKFSWIIHKKFWVSLRGSQPSPVRVSNKTKI